MTHRTLKLTHEELAMITLSLEANAARLAKVYEELIRTTPGLKPLWDDICDLHALEVDIKNGRKDV